MDKDLMIGISANATDAVREITRLEKAINRLAVKTQTAILGKSGPAFVSLGQEIERHQAKVMGAIRPYNTFFDAAEKVSQNIEDSVSGFKELSDEYKYLDDSAERLAMHNEMLSETYKKISRNTGVPITRIRGAMDNLNMSINTQGRIYDKLTGRISNQNKAYRDIKNSAKGFRMELLSVMFFGMAAQQLFMGMLTPAFELAGVFELIGIAMAVFFLPIALAVLDILLPVLDAFMNAPDSVKLFVGGLFLVGVVLATILVIFGQVGLGIDGITKAIPVMSDIWKKGMAGMSAAMDFLKAHPIIIVIMMIIAAVMILNEAWKNNWGGIRQHVGSFLQWFSGIYDAIIRPVLDIIGTGVIVLKNIIWFALTHLGAIWEKTWLEMQLGASVIWNAIVTGVELWVNAMLTPIKVLYDGIKALLAVVGVELPNIDFSIDTSSFLVDTAAMEDRIGELNTTLATDFAQTMEDTNTEVNAWKSGLNGVTDSMKKMGEEIYESGERIDAGLEKGTGFLDDMFAGFTNMNTSTQELNDKLQVSETNIDAVGTSIDTTKKSLDEARKSIEDYIASLNKIPTNVSTTVSSGLPVSPPKSFGDMIWRPGEPPVAISSADTIMASKGGTMNVGGAITTYVSVNATINNDIDAKRIGELIAQSQSQELRGLRGF